MESVTATVVSPILILPSSIFWVICAMTALSFVPAADPVSLTEARASIAAVVVSQLCPACVQLVATVE